MLSVFGALVFPESYYFSHRFPLEFHYEQRQQIAHLFTDVEGFTRPWDYYINVYWRGLLGPSLAVSGFLAMMTSLLPRLRNRRNVLLVLWILSYLVPLSFGVSKVANFIVPVLPAVILLVGFVGYDFLQLERRTFLYPLTGILLIVMLFHNNVSPNDNPVTIADSTGHRFLLLGVSLGIVLVLRLLSSVGTVFGVAPPSVPPRVAVAMVALMYFCVIVQNSKKNWHTSNKLPADYEKQMALKATANRIEGQIPQGAVVLVEDEAHINNAHLYFQYWSGVSSLPALQLAFAKRTLSRTHPLYLLVEDPFDGATLMEKVPYGYLYRID